MTKLYVTNIFKSSEAQMTEQVTKSMVNVINSMDTYSRNYFRMKDKQVI